MVRPFQFSRVPQIHFRNGIIGRLPDIAGAYGKSIVLVTGRSSFLRTSQSEKLLQDFKKSGFSINMVTIPGEPSPEDIDHAVNSLSDKKIDLVIGIGGGSVLDAGKAISAMMYRSEPVIQFLEGVGTMAHPGNRLRYIAVPTTSGTGSEATKNAVITRVGKKGFKRSLRHDNFVPDIALVDPELTLSCPVGITAASGMDCFTQLTEAYLSDRTYEYTDALAVEGLKAIKDSLVRTCKDGMDIEARAGMSFAALTSGICLANAGLGSVHGFASSVGARYDIPHGVICGTLMASANEVNVSRLRSSKQASPALEKYAALGKIFLGKTDINDEYLIDGFIEYLHNLTAELKLPGLKTAGVQEDDIREICEDTDCKNNPVKLTDEDLMDIIHKRYF